MSKADSIVGLLIVGAIFLGFGLLYLGYSSGDNTDFFTDYTVATNYIDDTILNLRITNINYGSFLDYVYDEDYSYTEAYPFLDSSVSLLDTSLENIERSKKILTSIRDKAPTDFYEKEVDLRMIQADILWDYSKNTINMIKLEKAELYEINFGSEELASLKHDELLLLYEKDITLTDSILDINKQIDIHWGENFYPN